VLDEATSALDATTENLISQTLNELTADVTMVIVAHRLATVRDCDQVVFLMDGRVEAIGGFEEVRAMSVAFDRQARLLGM
jgi:ABC-type multidrug transport system fused ATPase/permease subunit